MTSISKDNSTEDKIDNICTKLVATGIGFAKGESWGDETLLKTRVEDATQAINLLLTEAKEEGRNEIFEAIEDGRLFLRRFMTRQQIAQEYAQLNKSEGEQQ